MPPKGKRGSKPAAEATDDSADMRVNLFDIDSGEADAYSFTETDEDARGGDASRRSASGKGDQSYSRKLHSLSLNLQTKRALAERTSDTRTTKPTRQRFQLAPASFNVSPPSASTFSTSRKRRALFDDDEEDTDWRVPPSGSNGASHNYSHRGSGSRNASFLRGGGMPRRFRKGAFLVNELDVERARSDYTRVPLWRVEDAVSSLVRRYEPYPTDSMLYHRSTDSYRLTTGQEHNYHLVQSIVFVKKDDNVLLYHVRDWPKLTGAPMDGDDNGEGEVDEEGDEVDDGEGDGDEDGDADDNGESIMDLPNAIDSRDTHAAAGTSADVISRKDGANVALSNSSTNLTNNERVATASESPALN